MPRNNRKFLPWFKGTSFLLSPENNWPEMPFEKDQIDDVTSLFVSSSKIKPVVANNKLNPSEFFKNLINYYSDFHRLICSICYIFHVTKACFIKNRRKRKSF